MIEHLAAESLAAYVDGTLATEERAALESHLSRCRECLATVAEIVGIEEQRSNVPAEFLRRALGKNTVPARKALLLRPAFAIAAVFLVAIVLGYFFVGRGPAPLARIAEKKVLEQDAGLPGAAPAEHRGTGTAQEKAAERVVPGQDALAGAGGLREQAVSAEPPASAPPRRRAETAAAPAQERLLQLEDDADKAATAEPEGGVVGGVHAPPEKDKANDFKQAAETQAPEPAVTLSAAEPSAARAGKLQPNDSEISRRAGARGLAKSAASRDEKRLPARFPGTGPAIGAVQLLLAATGRATAPLVIGMGAWTARSAPRLEGEVGNADLLDPRQLEGWDWLPVGLALRLEIAADGTIAAAAPIGDWEAAAAEAALAQAGKLVFSPSGKRVRRAVLRLVAGPN